MKKKYIKIKANRHGQRNASFLGPGEISLWRARQDYFHYRLCVCVCVCVCARRTIGSPDSDPDAPGKRSQPTCADDILKSRGGAESCPSYSEAGAACGGLHGVCLTAQSGPSRRGKSPREVYLIWCLRRNKQINETLIHNTFIIIPSVFPCRQGLDVEKYAWRF